MGTPLPPWRYADRPNAGSFEGAETFVLQAGRARFQLGDRSIDAAAGEVVVVPPATAHRFRALGPERLRLVSVHAAARMETTWLEGVLSDP